MSPSNPALMRSRLTRENTFSISTDSHDREGAYGICRSDSRGRTELSP
jgi:hypothetical protein